MRTISLCFRRALTGALLLIVPLASGTAQRPTRLVLQKTVDSLVANALTEGPVAGMSVAVVRGRDTVVMKGYGFADVENDVRATPLTVYRIGSITKQFTAADVLRLVEEGKLSLDDSIGKHLSTLPAAWRGVTIRQLLNHTSGIPSYTGAGPRWATKMRLDLPHDTLIGIVANDPLDFPVGSAWRYNNSGYYLLGMLIERVTGHPYGEDLRDRFFAPLGLKGTIYCDAQPIIKHRAQGYIAGPNRALLNADPLSMSQPFSAGSLCSTVGDLVAWQRALAAGRVVKPASYVAMTTPEGAATGAHYGYGLGRDTLSGHQRVQHNGGINGFNSVLTFFPDDSLSIAVLGNTNGPFVDRVADNIARAALGLKLVSPPPRARDLPTTAEQRARYAGTYLLALPDGKTLELRVFERDGKLISQATGQPEFALMFQGNDSFAPSFDPTARLTFGPGSPASRVTLVQGGGTVVGERVR
jgi:CubicO group peptidase (beta-lactamase class C family)